MTADLNLLQLLAGVPADGAAYDWRDEAQCAQTDPEAFFPDKGGSTREAKMVCATCPVLQECLEWAIQTGETFGVWGGLTERERRAYARQHGLAFGSRRLPSADRDFEDYDDLDGLQDSDEAGDLEPPDQVAA
ncbi:WhiB family transcriptional regulator [Pseudactinotalea terrae]|uniref:WhiB family transcriptional regulator n=1 Tax=Pseudactinotalea terrae TaxID=1743262 RepID=UPI00240E6B0E|nr:WhiB family transcriptional regulator [Pseudactinotalea terrae]